MARPIPTITLWQPWASLVAIGAKRFEFRRWSAPPKLVGQRVAIHAGARPMKMRELVDLQTKLGGAAWRETGLNPGPALDLLDAHFRDEATIPLASIVCTATLGEPIRDEMLAQQLGTTFVNDSDRDEHSNWGWPLSEIRQLEPIVPARGHQGFWYWTPSDG